MDNLVITLPVLLKSLVECVKLVQLKKKHDMKVFIKQFIPEDTYQIDKNDLGKALKAFAHGKADDIIDEFTGSFIIDQGEVPLTLELFEQICK